MSGQKRKVAVFVVLWSVPLCVWLIGDKNFIFNVFVPENRMELQSSTKVKYVTTQPPSGSAQSVAVKFEVDNVNVLA